jgi:hypothetical protein
VTLPYREVCITRKAANALKKEFGSIATRVIRAGIFGTYQGSTGAVLYREFGIPREYIGLACQIAEQHGSYIIRPPKVEIDITVTLSDEQLQQPRQLPMDIFFKQTYVDETHHLKPDGTKRR